jgi:hypothetical protein
VSCSDCSPLAVRHEALHRECDRLRADVAELEAERAGLLAEVARLKERCSALAMQVTGVMP